MTTTFPMTAVAHVAGGRTAAEDDGWDAETADIVLAPGFDPDALLGLDAFSHAEIVFVFDRLAESDITTTARRPRGNPDWPLVGIFAQRGRNRPNRIGVSVCAIVGVVGTRLTVRGLDAIDGTPVLDIKPVLSGFIPRGAVREPDWARAIMADYW
ncbi:tRNA-Thr(GGU) m(6)t(6)A37 methyltransferase TsaA [alpha proteobacterium AAP81b]|nr:tRNA-Thr(GGU) m(6)t(6)A37 methyltransferase TsaA [alpha proteobacterium AAP81b]